MINKFLFFICFFPLSVFTQINNSGTNDSLIEINKRINSLTKLNPLINNSKNDEFSVMRINKSSKKNIIDFIYVSSKKMKGEKLKKNKIISNSTVYNLSRALIDTFSKKILEDKLMFNLNTNLQEGPSTLSEKDNKLFFTRSLKSMGSDNRYQLNIFQVSLGDEKSKDSPVQLLELEGNYSNMHPYFYSDKDELYFSSDRPGGFGGFDLYKVSIDENGVLGNIKNLGNIINSDSDEVFPSVYNKDVVFYSTKSKNGSLDIFMANRSQNGNWRVSMLKEPYLSEADDFGFSIDPSTNMGFMTSNRKGGMGGDDNYYFQIKPKLDGLIDTYFFETDTLKSSDEGVLKNDQDLIKREDPLQQLFTKEVIINETTKEGNLELNPNGSFKYIITNPLMAKDSFSYKIVSDSYSSKPISVYLNRKKDILSDKQITSYKLEPIFYKFDKFDLWNIYKDRFDKVIELLDQNPSFKLRISSYADARGSDSYNMKLSEERAISIFNFIKSQIVNNNFIELKSFGERAIKNNSYKNYMLIGGVFKNSVNANSIIKKIEKIGYSPVMIIDEKGFHKVVIDSFDYNFQAKKAKQELFKKNIESWIDKSPPIKEDESVHQKNRRVEFEIIK